ncbi:DUF4747 family protein [Shewanella psychrotolerans]|uniref:DUF4747 family protein n=1 Tax=Shewanella psychrotolerans TaxID=2864206 RepID=UPI001C65B6D1|nr:DUF4747 family protein [Shewanella psychrotolerans]QYK02417.1 DUF4747 family protein [Shewanella psychrotolerans]
MTEKKLVVGAINITIQPHSPDMYLKLFRDVYKLKSPIKISGDQYALLSSLHKVKSGQKEPGPITGDIYRFTSIDSDSPWFNLDTGDFADDSLMDDIKIPDNLKPNGARFSYIFYPEEHFLFYEGYYNGKSFGPQSAEKFIKSLLNRESIVAKYGKVDVTHIPSTDKLNDALKIPTKERIDMVITRPNADTFSKTQRRVMKRMNAINVETHEQSFKAIDGQSIKLDSDLTTMAKIAANNGMVSIKGKDINSKPIEYSTTSHPFLSKIYYNSKVQDSFSALVDLTLSLKDEITKWFK